MCIYMYVVYLYIHVHTDAPSFIYIHVYMCMYTYMCWVHVHRMNIINPQRTCTARVIVLGLSFRPSVRYHVFCHYAQQGGQKAIPTGSVPHWLDFLNGDYTATHVEVMIFWFNELAMQMCEI